MTLQSEPTVTDREPTAYVGLTRTVTMATMNEVADAIPEVIGWLAERGVAPAGAPFLRYLVIDMAADLVVEAGVPVEEPVPGDGEVVAGTLPAGRYVTLVHHGHPDELEKVTADLLAWAAERDLAFDRSDHEDGEHWVSRLERFLTHPAEVPSPDDWDTELAFKLADQPSG